MRRARLGIGRTFLPDHRGLAACSRRPAKAVRRRRACSSVQSQHDFVLLGDMALQPGDPLLQNDQLFRSAWGLVFGPARSGMELGAPPAARRALVAVGADGMAEIGAGARIDVALDLLPVVLVVADLLVQ